MNWYLLQTKPNAHFIALQLEAQVLMFFCHLPLKRQKNGKFLDIKAPLFQGYLFMGTAIDTIPWKSVNGTRGISKAVTLDGVYRSVSAHVIDGLQSRCDEDGIIQKLNDIAPDDRAKIERGAFAEFICTVEQIKDDQRAWVLIDLLQQQTRSEISMNNLSKMH